MYCLVYGTWGSLSYLLKRIQIRKVMTIIGDRIASHYLAVSHLFKVQSWQTVQVRKYPGISEVLEWYFCFLQKVCRSRTEKKKVLHHIGYIHTARWKRAGAKKKKKSIPIQPTCMPQTRLNKIPILKDVSNEHKTSL